VYRQFGYTYYLFKENGVWSISDTVPEITWKPNLTIDKNSNILHVVWGLGTGGIWYTQHLLPGVEETTVLFPEEEFCIVSSNPIDNRVELEYTLSKNDSVTLLISDILGRVVKKVSLGIKSAGEHKFIFTLKEGGVKCAGVYFITLKAGNTRITKKIIKF
jgi:hypothetical protein